LSDEAGLERARIGLRHTLILGTAQRPLEVPSWLAGDNPRAGRLALVAALGLRSRFDHPAPPPHLRRAGLKHEPERLMSREARAALRRVYGAKKRSVPRAVTLRVIDALAERGLCLHPFDFPALDEVLATNDAALDRNARLWRSLSSGGSDAVAPPDEIVDANWTDLKPAERAAYLRRRRREDAAAARALLAGSFASETAAVRAQLLEAMAVALSADDVEFLRSLGTDRAESVRTLAQRLIARIPGTSELDERMGTAHERLELKSVGIIGRKKVLSPKLPKGLAEAKVDAWLADSFAGVSTTLLAERLKLKREAFVDALVDERLRALFFVNALALDEHETALAIAGSLEFVDAMRIAAVARDALGALDPQRRSSFWNAFMPALEAGTLDERCAFAGELYEILRVPPPSAVMDAAATAKPWKRWHDAITNDPNRDQPEVPELAVTLADRAQRAVWRERSSELAPATAATALALAELFDALDSQSPKSE
jgi:hypothetical protein